VFTRQSNEKYKDELPIQTINRIRKMLEDVGILLVETWTSSVQGLYSLRLDIAGTNIGTNGKGTSYEYALASAYGEFIERLQNQLLYANYLSPATLIYRDFYYAPDEKLLTLEDMEKADGTSLKIFIPTWVGEEAGLLDIMSGKMKEWFTDLQVKETKYRILKTWRFCEGEGESSAFSAIPCYSVADGQIYYAPAQLMRLAYGSNGMCAGNSPEEAIVQGLSEILERHALRQIIKKKIVPPTIPDSYLKKFPQLYDIIRKIEQQGRYRLIVKDCSIGEGWPVAGVIFVDTENQSYYVRLGAHPDFAIALERCLTELFQGNNINTMSDRMKKFSFDNEFVGHPHNLTDIYRMGTGYYPAELFSASSSYEFSEFKGARLINREMLHYLTGLLTEKGYNVLLRDVSFLGFPSYQVFVPGMSEMYVLDKALIEMRSGYRNIFRIIRDLNAASEQELEQVIKHLLQRRSMILETDNIARLLELPVNWSFPWIKIKIQLFIAAAYYKMKKLPEAYRAMEKFTRLNSRLLKESGRSTYYSCVQDYLQGLSLGLEKIRIKESLSLFYPAGVIGEVMTEWQDSEGVFKSYGRLNCWSCTGCDFQYDCYYQVVDKLHRVLKDRYVQNTVDQERLGELFW